MLRHIVPLVGILCSCAAPIARPPLDQARVRLERDVRFLASDDMKGRDNGTPEGAAAAEYVAKRMAEAGLRPAGENGTWFQAIPGGSGDRGRNVIGALPGQSGRWIVIGAHHDGLGVRRGMIHNGADDNASGVAVILEVARRFEDPVLHHGLLFCSFDSEEDGLVGSTRFVASGLYPVESFAAMICLDLVGGSFLPGDERRIFALGAESSATLSSWVAWRQSQPGPLQLERAGIYMIEPMGAVLARSDYSPFRLKKIPFVFFSTGTPWYYHTPDDDVERVDFEKLTQVTDLVWSLAHHLGFPPPNQDDPKWREPDPDVEADAELLAGACRRVLEHPGIRASDRQRAAVAQAMEALRRPGKGQKGAVQQAMILLFAVAAAQKPAH